MISIVLSDEAEWAGEIEGRVGIGNCPIRIPEIDHAIDRIYARGDKPDVILVKRLKLETLSFTLNYWLFLNLDRPMPTAFQQPLLQSYIGKYWSNPIPIKAYDDDLYITVKPVGSRPRRKLEI